MKLVYSILGTYNSGGMERVLANKANYLAKIGYEIIIITTDQKERKPYFPMHESIRFIDLGVNYTEDLTKNIFARSLSYLQKRRIHKTKLRSLLHQIKPDITISMFDNDASFITDIKDGSKKVLEIHFSRFKRLQYGRTGIWKLIDFFTSKCDLNIVQKFDKFVVLTEEDKTYWGRLSNIEVIPNANSFESEIRAELQNKQVIAVGRFDYQKGFEDLIEVWPHVVPHFPDWKLNIYGNGPLKAKYQHMIHSLGLTDKITLKEPTKDIKPAYLEHSILVMTSRYEGLPMVLLEGQACGLPIVAYACKCGPKDIIQEGKNGFLIQEGDKNTFAERLKNLMENDALRYSMGGYSYENAANFDEDVIMKKWLSLFQEVVK